MDQSQTAVVESTPQPVDIVDHRSDQTKMKQSEKSGQTGDKGATRSTVILYNFHDEHSNTKDHKDEIPKSAFNMTI